MRPTLRTRKDVETFAPWKAAPRATASSPFKWPPSSMACFVTLVQWVLKKSLRVCCTLGTRTPPPMISTASTSSAVIFASRSAIRIGAPRRSKMPAAAASSLDREKTIEKSMSAWSDMMEMGISALAESTSLHFFEASRILAMARGMVRTSPLPHLALKPSATSSAMARSMAKPPTPCSQPLPRTSSWPTTFFDSLNVEYSTMDTCAASAPRL
mmetsp:Transcript_10961/g.36626  ORF Transcript_10961/g.36626 Transcript_10961/m.36626 type:complete len:213 (+) Transcript_10961:1630-2268(+)